MSVAERKVPPQMTVEQTAVTPLGVGVNVDLSTLPPTVQQAIAGLIRVCEHSDNDARTVTSAIGVASHLVAADLLPQSRNNLRLASITAAEDNLPFTVGVTCDGRKTDVAVRLPGFDKFIGPAS